MNELININGIECYEENGTAYLKLEAVARGLGFTQTQKKNGVDYTSVRWERVDGYLQEIGFPHKWGKDELAFATSGKRPDFIPENIFYRLAMKAKNETAEKFQALVADEVIPSIRKTGGYHANKPVCIEDVLIQSLQEMKEVKLHLAATDKRIDGIREVVAVNPNSWREETRRLLSKIAQARGGMGAYSEVHAEAYAAVDERAGSCLETRLTNLRRRMAEEGVCKSKRDKMSKIDVIAADKRLTEIYLAVVKDMALKYQVWEARTA